ncbi:MAG TPA: sodium:solute symporter [Candidatus Aminicenantes bacterium]|nr:sodium:solute symporter [Candidatus Aminicenantes bacterium]HRY64485.1 sodium:solute symporter [Candidatus Aminicenantes bacterium]HRZ71398.1 sodium:solute symporter [Candidatus Aminicenantes bacterium]
MNLTWIDWAIVAVVLAFVFAAVAVVKPLMRSVSDFLAAGRTGGRYLISLSQGTASLGAITIVGMLEMNYIAGFNMRWWEMVMAVVVVGISVSGWVLYRFRQTRCLTMAQFFEIRYNRSFRVFAGALAFVSGIINFGIFPAVSARFFIYFCGLPKTLSLAGLEIPTFALVMIVLLWIPLYFVFSGGQIAVMITDFLQGIFVNAVFIVIVAYLMITVDWGQIFQALSLAPADASLVNPFHTGSTKDYNFWYFFIGMIGVIYGKLSWQGTQAYNASAKSAHEAKMGDVLANWRGIPQWGLFLVFVPIVAYTFWHGPRFAAAAASVRPVLDGLGSEALRSQLTVPLALTRLLPVGLMGAFAAVMLAAAVGCNETYLHSWGSIFIQDVVMPIRRKPFAPDRHIRALKWSILAVAAFSFVFSLLFQQSEYIFLFFAITGAIFAGGSGAVIIGGLYWKRGTTAAAWSAMIVGAVTAVGGIVVQQLVPGFPVNGQMFWGLAMAASSLVYVAVSLLGGRGRVFDMDKMLHRGAYLVTEEYAVVNAAPVRGWKVLGMGREFTRFDRVLYIATYVWTAAWVAVFAVGTILNLTGRVADPAWMRFWRTYTQIMLAVSVVVIVWFSAGGLINLKDMIGTLRVMKRDHADTGFVERGRD